MRTYKFRAWHTEAKEMLYEDNPGNVFHWKFEGQPIAIMQFIGIKDVNGKEVYEGDIVETNYTNPFATDITVSGIITYNETGAYYEIMFPNLSQALCTFTDTQEITVLGNVYETAESFEDRE